ncbi:MAG: hypothetical protein LBL74_06095 [Bacteroidales bacterium]|nr:hypothetical protein [Bacteroidales bacterium]
MSQRHYVFIKRRFRKIKQPLVRTKQRFIFLKQPLVRVLSHNILTFTHLQLFKGNI